MKQVIWIWIGVGLLSAGLVTGCQDEARDNDLVELDLLPHGMPIVIMAPQDPLIETLDLVVQKDLTIKKGDYFVQIFESDATTYDLAAIKSRLLGEVQSNRYYQKIITEDPDGFIYETAIDSSYINYGFRRVRLQGDKEYIFQTGLRGKFPLEAVEKMYRATAK
ncbi:MAG: hypothetical protein R3301_10825 [Saprospiraceae bacterium]|nr:hypothetical protein [Saprospiraceae bacterium]